MKTSTIWSCVEMNWTDSFPCATFSRTKWKSTSTCFVRAWKTWLAYRYMAPKLSHYRVGTDFIGTRSSRNKVSSQVNSATVSANALYSDSVDDQDTVFCFLADYETRLDPRYIAYPKRMTRVWRRSSGLTFFSKWFCQWHTSRNGAINVSE